MSRFVDRVVLHLSAGDGGNGCASIHREKFKPLGGPDGGNGGHGGDIILEVSPQVHTLLDFHFHPHIKASRGSDGAGDHRNGARGEDLVMSVPAGTVVLNEAGETLADLTTTGMRFIAAAGGRGGLVDGLVRVGRGARHGPTVGDRGRKRTLFRSIRCVGARRGARGPELSTGSADPLVRGGAVA